MIKLGLIGTGRIGQIHAEHLTRQEHARLVTVADANPESARACAERHGLAVAPDLEAMLQDPTLTAIAICSSTNTHAEFIQRCARAGKHIFCEKPIDSDLARIDATLKIVEQAGVKLMVGFNRRFDANHQRIKRLIGEGRIGTPHLLHIISRDPAPPPIEYIRTSGGLFFDMTIHDFDMARFLLGEVEEIYASAGVRVDPAIGEAGDVDTALMMLRFVDGSMGTIDNSRQAVYGYDQRVEVFGSKGVVRSDNVYHDEVQLSTARRVERGPAKHFFLDRYMASYEAEMRAFVESLLHDQPAPVTGADGRAPVVLALAAKKSLAEHRPVLLSEIQ
jgi:myo-inositol 2-dehydrogenase/D-chiro-inositol 1-dehydrogenase